MTRGLSEPNNYATLRKLAAGVPATQTIVEIGTYKGASAIALADGARSGFGAHVVTIDPHDLPGFRTTTGRGKAKNVIDFTDPAIRLEAERAIMAAGHGEHITMVRAFSTDAAEYYDGPPVGMLHIDGDHREGAVRRDYAAWEPHLAPHAVVAFDDYRNDWFPGVVNVVTKLVDKGLLTDPVMYGRLAVCHRL